MEAAMSDCTKALYENTSGALPPMPSTCHNDESVSTVKAVTAIYTERRDRLALDRRRRPLLNVEPGKMILSAMLLVWGLMIILGGLSLKGAWNLLAIPGAFLILSVVDDTLLRTLRRYREHK
jgi:hypothetical protein